MLGCILVRRGGIQLKGAPQYLRRDTTTISSLVSRYERKMQEQPEFGRGVERLGPLV